eukprot:12889687-Prorocentrum_lima.AAC.1
MLRQRLIAEADEHKRNWEMLEHIAEQALRTRVVQVEARAETERLALASRVEAMEEQYRQQVNTPKFKLDLSYLCCSGSASLLHEMLPR